MLVYRSVRPIGLIRFAVVLCAALAGGCSANRLLAGDEGGGNGSGVTTGPGTGQGGGGGGGDFQPTSAAAAARKVATLLSGQAPSAAELAAVEQDPNALGGLVDAWMQTDGYRTIMKDFFATHF